jgi:hypothetical protein
MLTSKKLIKLFLFIIFSLSLSFFLSKPALASTYFQPQVRIFNTQGVKESEFLAYDENFKGGMSIASGDIDGDGQKEIITGAGLGGGPQVRVFESGGKNILSFFAFHPNFRGGIDVASGDVDSDGIDEIIVSQKSQGQAWIKVYKVYGGERVLAEFLAYNPNFEGGANIAAGDINGDGKDEIITGAGTGGGPHVRAFSGSEKDLGVNIFPYPMDFRGGVDVASANFDSDRNEEIVTSVKKFGTARIKVYKANAEKTILSEFLAFDERFLGGANISVGDVNRDGKGEIIIGAGSGGGPHVLGFNLSGRPTVNFMAYPQDFRGGVAVETLDNKILTASGRIIDQKRIIGRSLQGRTIEAYFFGGPYGSRREGVKKILFVGGTHAGVEQNGVELAKSWLNYLQAHLNIIPLNTQAIIIPLHNPDGYYNFSRFNARGVDLNRNFQTLGWQSLAFLWNERVSAGPFPFSEPETQALRNFIVGEKINRIIFFHSAANQIIAPQGLDGRLHQNSLNFARFYNNFAHYPQKYDWSYYPITGDLTAWAAQALNIPAITIELKNGYDIDWNQNLPAMIAALSY